MENSSSAHTRLMSPAAAGTVVLTGAAEGAAPLVVGGVYVLVVLTAGVVCCVCCVSRSSRGENNRDGAIARCCVCCPCTM